MSPTTYHNRPESEMAKARCENLEPICISPILHMVSARCPSPEGRRPYMVIEKPGSSTEGKKQRETGKAEKAILSPRALPPDFAGLTGTLKPLLQTEPLLNDLTPQRVAASSRWSVADRLSALVDQDAKMQEDSQNGFQILQPSGTHAQKKMAVYRNQSRSDPAALVNPSKWGLSCSPDLPAIRMEKDFGDGEFEKDVSHGLVDCTNAKVVSACTLMSKGQACIASPRALSAPPIRRQALDFHHPPVFLEDGNQRKEFHNFPSCNDIQNYRRKRGNSPILSHQKSSYAPFKIHEQSQISGGGSTLARRHTSTSTSHHARAYASRATSLFSALWPERWWKFILVDKKTMLQDVPRRSSAPVTKTKQSQREKCVRHTPLPCLIEDHLPEKAKQRSGSDHNPSIGTTKPPSEKFSMQQIKTKDSTNVPAQSARLPSMAAPGPGATETTTVRDLAPASFESKHKNVSAHELCDGDFANTRSNFGEFGKDVGAAASPNYLQRKPPSLRSIEPERCAGSLNGTKEPSQWDQFTLSERPSGSPQISTRSASTRPPPESVHGTSRWKNKGTGKGIRKVQVIVSLDGAEDIIIEAEVQKEPVSSSANS